MQRLWSAAATAAGSAGCALSEHCNASKKRLRFARFPLFSLCSSLSSPLSFPLSLPLPLHTLSLLAAYNLTGEIQFPKCWNCRRRPVANANAVDGAQARLAPPSVVHLFPQAPLLSLSADLLLSRRFPLPLPLHALLSLVATCVGFCCHTKLTDCQHSCSLPLPPFSHHLSSSLSLSLRFAFAFRATCGPKF